MTNIQNVFVLLLLFQAKHFIADYPLQTTYMLGKFKSGTEWIKPLLAHVGVHGALSVSILVWVNWKLAVPLTLLDMSLHFIMDRIKASPKLLGRFKSLDATSYKACYWMAEGRSIVNGQMMWDFNEEQMRTYRAIGKKDLQSNTYFWWSLGLDQMVHHLTHYLLIYLALKGSL